VPGDKSLTHRMVLLGLLAQGTTVARHALEAADIDASIRLAQAFGAVVTRTGDALQIVSPGLSGLSEPPDVVDCGNSGTTMRLGCGIAALVEGLTVLTGDASLRRRPMRRVLDPLATLGAAVLARTGGVPPVAVRGPVRRGGAVTTPVPSAQVKSAVLLAGLGAPEPVTVHEAVPTRDHTERLLEAAGVSITWGPGFATVEPGVPRPLDWTVPGDPSSAAFWWVLAAITGGTAETPGVLLNPTRAGVLDTLRAAGAGVAIAQGQDVPEPTGTVRVAGGDRLQAFRVSAIEVPSRIDELPLLAVLATQCDGETVIAGAEELRVKESDRIAAMAEGLNRMGAAVTPTDDGWRVRGPTRLHGAVVESRGDHRVAMALAVASAVADTPTTILGADAVAISYPAFWHTLHASGSVQMEDAAARA
jgi:3-phosphoshikimate 1-carboxyvinyltransferase